LEYKETFWIGGNSGPEKGTLDMKIHFEKWK
ncbi:MAG: hypothetical protein US55_C0006G0001, partial [Candidatus Levybacteria bacterium GW2011_GWC2_37_7]